MYLSIVAFLFVPLGGDGVEPSDPASRILTYKQYAQIKHNVPYVLEFSVGKGALVLYGGRHVFAPGDPQIADIQKEWQRFQPDVAYNEGGNPPTDGTVKGAVERFGEAGLVRYLAAHDQVPVATFEPSRESEVRELRKHYSGEQVKVFSTLRAFLTFRRSKSNQSVQAYINNALGDPLWKDSGIPEGPNNIEEFGQSCKKLLPALEDWQKVPDAWFDPTQSGQFTNDMQNENGLFRDRHIFKLLVARAQRGDRVFAVIGASHVPVQEPALVAALGEPVRKRNGGH